MRPIMPIFMNNYLQILERCERASLFQFDHLNKGGKNRDGFNELSVSDSKLKKFNSHSRNLKNLYNLLNICKTK